MKQWLLNHKISIHTLVVAWGVLDVMWYTNTDFHAYVAGLLMKLPSWAHGIVFGLIVPFLAYYKAQKPKNSDTV